MKSDKEYFKILGITPTTSKSKIKKAYYALSKEHHPDIGGDPERFRDIEEAYSMLTDKKKRFIASLKQEPIEQSYSVTLDELINGKTVQHQITLSTIIEGETTTAKLVIIQDSIEPLSINQKLPITKTFRNVDFGIFQRDVNIKYVYETHPRYQLHDEGGILVNEKIPLFTALLGGTVEIETPLGVEELLIPAGTPEGKIFTLQKFDLFKFRVQIDGYLMPSLSELSHWTITRKA